MDYEALTAAAAAAAPRRLGHAQPSRVDHARPVWNQPRQQQRLPAAAAAGLHLITLQPVQRQQTGIPQRRSVHSLCVCTRPEPQIWDAKLAGGNSSWRPRLEARATHGGSTVRPHGRLQTRAGPARGRAA